MSRIFLSHSSKDNFEAIAIRDWLAEAGWNDVFLDLDVERGIAAGERWERALHEAAMRCEAVIFLVTSAWLASGWCLKEYYLARTLNKKLFAVIVDAALKIDALPPELKGHWQAVDLMGGQDTRVARAALPGSHEERHVTLSNDGLQRLRRGLEKAGLDPRFFAWPPETEPDRAPYRGLKPLEGVDAGVFFGRDAPIIEATDRLRGLRVGAAPRLLVILGASGAGKSSFLRAGLLPRLARDDSQFLPLPVIRPEHAALYGENGLLVALEGVLPSRTRAELRAAIQGGAAGLRPLLAEIAQKSFERTLASGDSAKPPIVMLAIDQAEELFRIEGGTESAALLKIVHDLTADDAPDVLVVFAIRSDSYDALEHAKLLEGLPQATLPLLPMPRGTYKEVIEEPLRRVERAGGKLSIEPRLTERLMDDIEKGGGSDALPLLAFTLEQLYLEYRRAGILRLVDYEAYGGLKGAIHAAVERAFARADADPRIPRERTAREALLRRGLIPWLAGIDPETKSPRRNIARRADIPAEAAPLVDLLVEERLLSTDTVAVRDPVSGSETRVATIEPTHEALLRQWGLLEGWLAEDFGLLATLEGLKRAARDWDANQRDDAWLAHKGPRLAEAQTLDARADIAARLDAVDRAYIADCRLREDAALAEADQRRREREEEQARRLADARKLTRRTGLGLAAAMILALAAVGFGFYATKEARIADEKTRAEATATIAANAAAAEAQTQSDAAKTARDEAKAALISANAAAAEARTQRDAAEMARKDAQAQRDAAQAAKRVADQRAALLAANVSQTFLSEGSLDAATLLLLRAAKAFSKDDAPDDLMIALSATAELRDKVSVSSIPQGVAVFDELFHMFLYDGATDTLYVLRKNEAIKLFSGGSQSPITNLRELPDHATVLTVRKNGAIERFGIDEGKPVLIATLPKLPDSKIVDPVDENYVEPPTIDISEDGVVVRFSHARGAKGETKQAIDLVKTDTGASLFQSPTTISDLRIAQADDGGVYILDAYEPAKSLKIAETAGKLVAMPFDAASVADLLPLGSCLKDLSKQNHAAFVKATKDEADKLANPTTTCKRYGPNRLVTMIGHTSAGDDRHDFVFNDEGEFKDVTETLKSSAVSSGNFTWAGVEPTTGMVAGVLNRDVMIDAFKVNELTPGGVLRFRLPDLPAGARFIDKNHLAVIDTVAGRIVTFDLRNVSTTVSTSFESGGESSIVTAMDRLHFGRCSPTANSVSQDRMLADGSKEAIRFPEQNQGQNTIKIGLDLSQGGATAKIDLVAQCAELSSDARYLLVTYQDRVVRYDVADLIRSRQIQGGQTVPFTPSAYFSASLVEATGDVVTSDNTNRILDWHFDPAAHAWQQTIIYQGDNPIMYAEPDASGDKLAMMEDVGGDDVRGLVYSVSARKVWYRLGQDYKWLDVWFTRDGRVAVQAHDVIHNLFAFPSFDVLVAHLEATISPSCAWKPGIDFKSSPCWPRSIE